MDFTEKDAKMLAQQLRKPEGEMGVEVGNMMNQGNMIINQDAIKALSLEANDRLLEVGPGNGVFASQLIAAAENVTYAGCDYSSLMVDEATALNQTLIDSNQAKFVHAECDNMPFENGAFTKILTVNTIYFWADPQAVLSEFYRVLASSGRLVIGLRPEANMKAMPFTKYGFTFFTEDHLIKLFEASPFSLVEIQRNVEKTIEFAGKPMPLENFVVAAEKK
jgi:SAM-dependent methyltransferase